MKLYQIFRCFDCPDFYHAEDYYTIGFVPYDECGQTGEKITCDPNTEIDKDCPLFDDDCVCDLTHKQREIMCKMQDRGTMYFMERNFPSSSYWFFIAKTVNEMVNYSCDDVNKLVDLGLIKIQRFEGTGKNINRIATLTKKGKNV